MQGYSHQEAGDAPFELLVSHSKLSGNPPGADVAESIFGGIADAEKNHFVHDSRYARAPRASGSNGRTNWHRARAARRC